MCAPSRSEAKPESGQSHRAPAPRARSQDHWRSSNISGMRRYDYRQVRHGTERAARFAHRLSPPAVGARPAQDGDSLRDRVRAGLRGSDPLHVHRHHGLHNRGPGRLVRFVHRGDPDLPDPRRGRSGLPDHLPRAAEAETGPRASRIAQGDMALQLMHAVNG
jgi:hypothetical protein